VSDEKQERRTELDDKDLWPLALSYLKRADDAANYLRALMFTLAGAAIAYLTTELKGNLNCGYLIALILFAIAIALIVVSWDIQKKKAGQRFEALRDFGFARYQEVNAEIAKSIFFKNYVLDRSAYILILIGFVISVVTKLSASGTL
jgi:hypothetical protein